MIKYLINIIILIAVSLCYIQHNHAQQLVCNDELEVSLNQDCTLDLSIDILLEITDSEASCLTYQIYDDFENQNPIDEDDIFTYVNQCLPYEIKDNCEENSCWGEICIENINLEANMNCECESAFLDITDRIDGNLNSDNSSWSQPSTLSNSDCVNTNGNNGFYQTYQLFVDEDQEVSFTVISGDVNVSFYENNFIKEAPCENLIAIDDNTISDSLFVGKFYFLVVSGNQSNTAMDYSININGLLNFPKSNCLLNCVENIEFAQVDYLLVTSGLDLLGDHVCTENVEFEVLYESLAVEVCGHGTKRRTTTFTVQNSEGGSEEFSCVQEFYFVGFNIENAGLTEDGQWDEMQTGKFDFYLPEQNIDLPCGVGFELADITDYFDVEGGDFPNTDFYENNEGIPYAVPYFLLISEDLELHPYLLANTCNVDFAHTDNEVLPSCDSECFNSIKISRTWTIIDWCAEHNINFTQIITVSDTEGPTFELEDITVSTDLVDCTATFEFPGPLNVFDECNSENFTSNVIGVGEASNYLVENNAISELPIGIWEFEYTVADCCGNAVSKMMTVSVVDNKPPTPSCADISTALIEEEYGVQLWACDFDQGAFDNCTSSDNLIFTFDGPDEGVLDPENAENFDPNLNCQSKVFSCVDQDAFEEGIIPITIYVWDESGNVDFCNGDLKLISDCSISQPEPVILSIDDTGGNEGENTCVNVRVENFEYIQSMQASIDWNPSIVSYSGLENLSLPGEEENLFNLADTNTGNLNFIWFDISGTTPLTLPDREIIFSICFDLVGSVGQDSDIIWSSSIPLEVTNTEGVVDVETIDGSITILEEVIYICDFLPRSAPFTDCDGGHSIQDDVEWPNDLQLNDHRILPEELFTSLQDPLDAQPSLENSLTYSVDYEDILDELMANEVVLDRTWTIVKNDNAFLDWHYDQRIIIDISSFSELVTVNTSNSRFIPDVEVADGILTDAIGSAIVQGDILEVPTKQDQWMNGLNIRDLVIIQNHILGLSYPTLNISPNVAFDVNEDNVVSAVDVIDLSSYILGIKTENYSGWKFNDATNDIDPVLQPKKHFIGYKLGDVDNSATLGNESSNYIQDEIYFEDQLINNGESYITQFEYKDSLDILGIEFRIRFDTSAIVDIVVSPNDVFDFPINSHIKEDILTITGFTMSETPEVVIGTIDEGIPLFTIEFLAQSNALLKDVMNVHETLPSFLLDNRFDLHQLGGLVEGEIESNTDEADDELDVEIYPNPANQKVFIDYKNDNKSYTICLVDIMGKEMIHHTNVKEVDVTNYPSGVYTLYISDEKSRYKIHKLLITH